MIGRRAFLAGLLFRDRVATAAELAAAARAARPGDVIVLAAGEWRDADLVVDARGEEGAPVRILAEEPGSVVLTGRSRLRLGGNWTTVEGLHFKGADYPGDLVQFRTSTSNTAYGCKLLDCAIVDSNPADLELNTKWISLYGAWNEVSRCYFAAKRNIGTTLVVWLNGTPNHHRIGECWFGPRPPLGVNGGETIRIGDSSTSMQDSATTVENNYFERCNGEVEAISNKSCANLYRSNFFDRCEATLTLRHGNRCRVEGNYFHGGGSRNSGGVRIIGEDHIVVNNRIEACNGTGFRAAISVVNGLPDSPLSGYLRVKRALVAHNTILDCAQPVVVGTNGGNADLTETPEDVRVVANLIGPRDPAPAAEDVAEVTEDIDGQPRGTPKLEGCDEPSDAPKTRWQWGPETAGPRWWPRTP